MNLRFLCLIFFYPVFSGAMTMEQTIKISHASSIVCLSIAQDVGGDEELFEDLNADIMMMSDRVGYVKNVVDYHGEMKKIGKVIFDSIIKIHKNKLDAYNEWCVPFYNGVIQSVENNKLKF